MGLQPHMFNGNGAFDYHARDGMEDDGNSSRNILKLRRTPSYSNSFKLGDVRAYIKVVIKMNIFDEQNQY
jgi:hypothetical protein